MRPVRSSRAIDLASQQCFPTFTRFSTNCESQRKKSTVVQRHRPLGPRPKTSTAAVPLLVRTLNAASGAVAGVVTFGWRLTVDARGTILPHGSRASPSDRNSCGSGSAGATAGADASPLVASTTRRRSTATRAIQLG